MLNTEIYKEELCIHSAGVLTGIFDGESKVGECDLIAWNCPIVKAFLAEDDIQEIVISSSCIGFTNTIRKQYKKS